MRLQNYAFIDGQNLHLGTAYKINYARFRVYLKDKYKAEKVFYYIGHQIPEHKKLYQYLIASGYILKFREHSALSTGKKKGNVDTDIVFDMMKHLVEQCSGNIILVSGDGDYKKVVDYLIKKNKFEKILFPNKHLAYHLYKSLGDRYGTNLNQNQLQKKFGIKKRG